MQRGNEFACGVHPLLLVINTIKETAHSKATHGMQPWPTGFI